MHALNSCYGTKYVEKQHALVDVSQVAYRAVAVQEGRRMSGKQLRIVSDQ